MLTAMMEPLVATDGPASLQLLFYLKIVKIAIIHAHTFHSPDTE